MAWVTQELIDVWNAAQFVGPNTPHAVIQVQLGHWVRSWQPWNGPIVNASIWGEGGYGPSDARSGHWVAEWHSSIGEHWITVPNITQIKRTRDLAQNGVTVIEVVLDASDYVPKIGALGDAYHVIAPGWLAPTRNYVGPARPDPRWDESPWAPHDKVGRLTDSVAIRVWQGFGKPETVDGQTPPVDGGAKGAWTFRGMIDDVDVDGDPNTLTITARNGKLLTDQRVFRACKSVQLKDPITFYDSNAADDVSYVGKQASASSTQVGFPAKQVLEVAKNPRDPDDPVYSTAWSSGRDISDTAIEWIEIRLPQGKYTSFWINTPPGYFCYAGIYARNIAVWEGETNDPRNDPTRVVYQPTMDGNKLSEGWIDLGQSTKGRNGGWPYVMTFHTRTAPGTVDLQHVFELGDRSILRIGFARPKGSAVMGQALCRDLHGLHRKVDKEIIKQQFILVDDASEVVKVALRWAGYTEWDVEEAGVRLSDGTNYGPGVVAKSSGRLKFNRQNYLIDIIQEVGKQLGFIFYIADPTDANSEGVPTFRRDSSLLVDNHYVAAHLDESNMLTGVKVKHTDSDRPYIVRVRGKTAKPKQGGVPLGGDSVRRIMAVYIPPWSFGSRTGGIMRHIVYQDDQLTTYAMCLFGCLLIGMNAALAMHTAVAEIPCHPMLELDDQVSILDEPTGTNSRMWIVKTEDTMTLGQGASWKQTLEGSLLDTEDLQAVIAQTLGRAPITIGYGSNRQTTIEHINWRRIRDPDSGDESGYRGPTLEGVTRQPKTRH